MTNNDLIVVTANNVFIQNNCKICTKMNKTDVDKYWYLFIVQH